MSRMKNAIRNAIVGVVGQAVILLLQFVNRSVFIMTLGKSYLGTNGLFNDILSMLSVAELGLGTAIVYAMYRPMAENDKTGLAKLVWFYRSAYTWIGSIFLGVGLLLTPFLRYLIQGGGTEIEHLQLIYMLVLLNASVGYFFSYKITLITVAQKAYVSSLVNISFKILQSILQMIVLFSTRNYILYLCVQLACTIGTNVVSSAIASREFKDVFEIKDTELSEEQKRGLLQNVKALLMHRLGNFFVNGTDNLIISKFLGLAVSGVYSNYRMLTSSITSFVTPIFDGLTASVGNLNVLESRERNRDIFEKINFMSFWIACFCCCCFMALMNPFIYILSGNDASYLFDLPILSVIILNFYLSQMRTPVLTFKNAMGLYWQDRWKPLIESAINIVFSLILVKCFGFIGVLLGTSISTISVVLAVEPQVIYRYGFSMPVSSYFVSYVQYFGITVGLCFLAYWITNRIVVWGGWLGLLGRLGICLVVPNVVLYLLFRRTEKYKYFVHILSIYVDKIMTKISAKKGKTNAK